eukprot:TRINITY_DN30088_c0_g1_i1.p1 TRINITY_DN30088_c0_g1~~TRINITY_DN30088_c0_g1_i1.p1  ORF type:complete len:382 (-),score=54.69 TRINITY_DN30088_c0_g1_i1:2-1147(-)
MSDTYHTMALSEDSSMKKERGGRSAEATRPRAAEASKAKALGKGLERLQAVLAALPRGRRRCAVERLSVRLRAALIERMEAVRWKRFGRPRGASSSELEKGASRRGRTVASLVKLQSESHETGLECVLRHEPSRQARLESVSSGSNRRHGAVSAIRVGCSMQYIARITICGISVSSRCEKSYEQAEQLRRMLASLRSQLEEMGTHDIDMGLRAAFSREGVVPRRLPADLQPLQELAWSFRVLVDVRAWAGRLLTSKSFGSIAEALALRRRVQAARLHGWEALRATWAECMSQRAGNAVSYRLASLDASRAAKLHCYMEARTKRAAARQDRQCRFLEGRLFRLVPRLEKQLSGLGGWRRKSNTHGPCWQFGRHSLLSRRELV